MSFTVPNRDLVAALFVQLDDSLYECKICHVTRAQTPKKGYTNLVDHLTRSHEHAAVQHAFDQVQRAGVLSSVFVDVSPAAKAMHNWIEWIVMENRELSFCEHDYVRKNTKLPKTSRASVLSCMEDVSDLVRAHAIERLNGRRLGLAFDAWTANGYHFVAVIAVLEPRDDSSKHGVREQILLTFQPIDPKHYDPTKKMFDSDAIIELFDEALDSYHLHLDQLCFLVGDNASVNGSVSRKAELPIIGCANHRLNLAVEQHIAMYADEVKKVEKLMVYLRTSKVRSVLRKINCPSPLLKNATRWSSTFLMLQRYTKISAYLDDTTPGLAPLLLTPQERVNIIALLTDLEKFQSVCMKLQNRDGVTLLDARILFDKLLDVFKEEGSCVKHLSQGAKVVEVPEFENGIVKVQDGRANELTRSEKKSLNRFLRTADDGANVRASETLGFADSALKEKREHLEPKYVNLDWIPPTSDDVERLFSMAGLVYSNRRMAMLPDTLELILYLRFNRHLWNEVTVAEAIHRREESRRRKRQLRLDEVERGSVV